MAKTIQAIIMICLLLANCATATNWDMFGKDPVHNSRYTGSTEPQSFGVLWKYPVSGRIVSSPAVSDGKIFFGAGNGYIYSLYAQNGQELWSKNVGSIVYSSPAVYDGKVLIGAYNNKMYILNALTGAQVGGISTFYRVNGGITVSDGVAYFGDYSRRVYAVNASNSARIWTNTDGYDWYSAGAAVYQGKVFIGNLDNILYALDAATGVKKWEFDTKAAIETTPAVYDNTVFISATNGKLYALDASTGSLKWEKAFTNSVYATTTISSTGVLFVGDMDGTVHALNANTGADVWSTKLDTEGTGFSTGTITDNALFIASTNGIVYALDPTNGQVIWSYFTGSAITVYTGIAAADGVIYIGTDNAMYAFTSVCNKDTSCTAVKTLHGENHYCRDIGNGYDWYKPEEARSLCRSEPDIGKEAFCSGVGYMCGDDFKWHACTETTSCADMLTLETVFGMKHKFCRNFGDGWKWVNCGNCGTGQTCQNKGIADFNIHPSGTTGYCANTHYTCTANNQWITS